MCPIIAERLHLPVVVLAFNVLCPDPAAAADTSDKTFEEIGAVTSGKGRGRCPVLFSYLLDGVALSLN